MARAAFEKAIGVDGIPANADLSSYQYYAVAQNSSGNAVMPTVAGQKCYGLMKNAPESGETAEIVTLGPAIGVLAGSVSYDDYLTVNSSGALVAATSEEAYIVGRALSSGTSGCEIPVWVLCGAQCRTAPLAGFAEVFDYGASKGLAILQADGTAYDSTADVHNVMTLGSGNKIVCVPIVGQTIPPAMAATGLDIQGDQVSNDGFMLYSNIGMATGRPFVVGVDAAFYFKCEINMALANGTDDLHIGFRRAETPNATVDNYLDMASLGLVGAASPGAINIETILNNGATTTTDTTDTIADATDLELTVLVSAAGVVTYLIDGVAPTVTAAFTFDDGDPVIPFLDFLQATSAQTGAFLIKNWEVGYQ